MARPCPERAKRVEGQFVRTRSQPPRDAALFFVYVLECVDGSFYVGHTHDLCRRVKAHGDGTAANYTSTRRPVRLVHVEVLPTREVAVRRERQLKGWTRAKKRALIRGDVDQLHQLSRRTSSNSE
jgi:predicted GIY-YIG superfamily endonuclease